MKNTYNPDNRFANKEIIKTKINNTKHNTEIANEIINKTDNDQIKKDLLEKNAKRRQAVNHLGQEISHDSND